jgi:hypothetical protein
MCIYWDTLEVVPITVVPYYQKFDRILVVRFHEKPFSDSELVTDDWENDGKALIC